MMKTRSTRILCVDDHEFICNGLEARFGLEPDLEFVGHECSADQLDERVKQTAADVVILDIDMPGMDPFVMIRDLGVLHPNVRVIMLSAYVRDHYIDRALDEGAWGFFSKCDAPEELVEGIRCVAGGRPAFGTGVRRRLDPDDGLDRGDAGAESLLEQLTPRELEILRLIGRGLSRAEIANLLHRSLKTIDAHHTSIMRKLDIHDRVELALYAVREGLVEGAARQ